MDICWQLNNQFCFQTCLGTGMRTGNVAYPTNHQFEQNWEENNGKDLGNGLELSRNLKQAGRKGMNA